MLDSSDYLYNLATFIKTILERIIRKKYRIILSYKFKIFLIKK